MPLTFTKTNAKLAAIKDNPFADEVAKLDPEAGVQDSRTFPVTYADAREQFADRPAKETDDKKLVTDGRIALTDDEAITKYVSALRRDLTEAGNRADPPVTVRFEVVANDDDDDENAPEFIGQFWARPKVTRSGESEETAPLTNVA